MTVVRNERKGSNRDVNDRQDIRNLTLYLLSAILVLLCIVIRILMEYKIIHLDETLSKIVSDVLSGILASALIAPIFAFFSDRSLMLWIGTTVSDHLRETLNALDAERATHLPSHVFDSQLRYDPRFNEVMSSDFERCSFFPSMGRLRDMWLYEWGTPGRRIFVAFLSGSHTRPFPRPSNRQCRSGYASRLIQDGTPKRFARHLLRIFCSDLLGASTGWFQERMS
jgi:hypothetical protein